MSTLCLHNTLSGQEETFIPLQSGRVLFYTCGPTVYDYAHIGNFRSFLAADLLRRWLGSSLCRQVDASGAALDSFGYAVTQVMNITDVGHMTDDDAADGDGEDKMEAARKRLLEDKKSGRLPAGAAADLDPSDPYAIARFYADAFVDDARLLGMQVVRDADDDPSLMPRPTQSIRAMLDMIVTLIETGHAYVASDGVAYFSTESFPAYGALSGNTMDAIRSGAGGRVSDAQQAVKKHPADFMLWKPDPTHLMRWDPAEILGRDIGLGEGYPGWHLECSAMAREALKSERIDLHSGGEDNIFPHHECEIAQSCCAHGTDIFARYWFHARFLQVEGEKMSKSKGNFFTVRDLTSKGFTPAAIRLELIRMHYRSNANFTEQGLKDSQRNVDRWRGFLAKAAASSADGVRDEEAAATFTEAMNDDLNIGGAMGALNSWINRTPEPTRADAALLDEINGVLGVLDLSDDAPGAGGDSDEDAHIDDLVRRRTEARTSKDWGEADRIRDELTALNVVVEDTAEGPKWSRKATL